MYGIRLKKIRQDTLTLSAKYTHLRSDQLIAAIRAIKRGLTLFSARKSGVVLTSCLRSYRKRK